MTSPLTTGLIAVAVVVVLGIVLRRASGGGSEAPATLPPDDRSEREERSWDEPDEDEDEDGANAEAVAVTSDGLAFVPDVHAVRLVPPAEDEDEPWAVASREGGARNRRGDAAFGMSLNAGDLTGVRITRGGADESPWLLETLGRDGEYLPWGFESREAAEAARTLLEAKRIVHVLDDQGEPRTPPSSEAWGEARRRWEETQAHLAMDDPDEDPR